MKSIYFIFMSIFMTLTCHSFADNVQERIARVQISSIPFKCIKEAKFPRPLYAFPNAYLTDLPVYLYSDLALHQTDYDENIDCSIFRHFKVGERGLDLIAVDLTLSELSKKVLIVYDQNNCMDCLEVEVCWGVNGILSVKQWRIDSNENIIVTWIKVDNATPISAFSDFGSVEGQRIDMYYTIDGSGHFRLDKEVRYKPQTYTQSYLEDASKELWDGNEVPLD